MATNHYIVTGASRGIGLELAVQLLEKGNIVYGVSRQPSELVGWNEQYVHFTHDLEDVAGLDRLVYRILEHISPEEADRIVLINNAAMLEPLKRIDQCDAAEISRHVNVSLVAPMVLSSALIRLTDDFGLRRQILNVSSGSAIYPAPFMSVYCTSKAGLNMFTQSVAMEQAGADNKVDIIAIDPGMVDTDLQAVARGKSQDEFALSSLFSQAYEAGQLRSPRETARLIIEQLDQLSDPEQVIYTLTD